MNVDISRFEYSHLLILSNFVFRFVDAAVCWWLGGIMLEG